MYVIVHTTLIEVNTIGYVDGGVLIPFMWTHPMNP